MCRPFSDRPLRARREGDADQGRDQETLHGIPQVHAGGGWELDPVATREYSSAFDPLCIFTVSES